MPPVEFRFWDVVAIIIGIVVGTAIFKSPTLVFQNSAGAWQALALWVVGGGLSLCGAVCYAELATAFPKSGGDYIYLNRAYGSWLGFLFGWAQLAAILSGSIAAMAYAFGDYAVSALDIDPALTSWFAIGGVLTVSSLNLLGLNAGKTTQNLLSIAKVGGLLAIVVAGFLAVGSEVEMSVAPQDVPLDRNLGLALVFVLYAFGGWNDAVFVAAEVRDPQRNLPRALLLGISGITLIYVSVNVAILLALGFDGACTSSAPAADAVRETAGEWASRGVGVLVAVSALGAINGMILTGTRVYAALGNDHQVFAWLGRWNQSLHAPINAIVSQAAMAVALIVLVGSKLGQEAIDRILELMYLPRIPWEQYFGGFETLVASTAPVFWSFFLLTGVAVVVLRIREPDRPRPFRVPWYPWPVMLFCMSCGYMLVSSVSYAKWLTLIGILPLLAGVPLYVFTKYRYDQQSRPEDDPP